MSELPPPEPSPTEPQSSTATSLTDGRRQGWWRSEVDRYLAGVAGGLGERWSVDPLFVRLALVVATLLGASSGIGVLVPAMYAAAWILLPIAGERSILRRLRRDERARREAAGVVLLLVATAVVLPRLGPGGSASLRAGIALLGVAVLLLSNRHDDDVDHQGPPPPTGADDAGSTAAPPATARPPGPGGPRSTGSVASTARRLVERRPALPTWRPTRRRRPRSGPALWPLTVAALAIWAVACIAADEVLASGLAPGVIVSGALLIVGAVLVLSAWRGRARSTILLGAALLPAWVGFSVSGVERFDGEGDRFFRPSSVEEASGRHELGYGRLVLDLRGVELGPGEVLRTGVAVTAGLARVVVPGDTNLVVMGPVGLGSVGSNPRDRWDRREVLAVDRTLDWRYGPQARRCQEQDVPVDGLSFSDGTFGSVDELTAELERRGWDPPRPSRPARDLDGFPHELVTVAIDHTYRLCDATLPTVPEDPATIVVRVELGIADLEVTRVQPA